MNWAVVLDHLEGEVRRRGDHGARPRRRDRRLGTARRRLGPAVEPRPLPADLRERAARLLQHQLAVAEALVERITQSQRQRDVAARMSYGPLRPVPSYIDRAL